MRRASLLSIGLISGILCAQEWRQWSPRPSNAPKLSRVAETGELVAEGGGNAGVFGGWELVIPEIRPHQWYRLEASYKPSGLEYEPLQVPVRLDWIDAAQKRAGQPDYAWRVKQQEAAKGWRTVALTAPAPDKAAAVKVQLLLQNAPGAKILWKDVSLKPVDAPGPRKVNIAAIRLRPKGPDPLTHFIQLVETGVNSPTDLIVLPEGITLVGTGRKYADVAEPIPGPTTERLGKLAVSKNAWIVAGILELDGRLIYNTAVLVDRAGKVAGKYRKVYLPREELEGGVTPGSKYPVFQTDFGTLGMMICWDVQYADPSRAMALRGAELIAMPIWGGNETLAKARAIENQIFLATSGYDFPSLVFDPHGETLARSEENATIARATIDLNRRYTDPWLGEMRGRFFRELRGDIPYDPPGRK